MDDIRTPTNRPKLTREQIVEEYEKAMALFPEAAVKKLNPLFEKAGVPDSLSNRVAMLLLLAARVAGKDIAAPDFSAEPEPKPDEENQQSIGRIEIALEQPKNDNSIVTGILLSEDDDCVKLVFHDSQWKLRRSDSELVSYPETERLFKAVAAATKSAPSLVAVACELLRLTDLAGSNNIDLVCSLIKDQHKRLAFCAQNPESYFEIE